MRIPFEPYSIKCENHKKCGGMVRINNPYQMKKRICNFCNEQAYHAPQKKKKSRINTEKYLRTTRRYGLEARSL
jgi:hypothetical protein